MILFKRALFYVLRRAMPFMALAFFCLSPMSAYADSNIIDALNLAPFIPNILDALMTVATGGY